MKLHLGCGEHRLEGWENCDREVDIRKPLPWPDGSADRVFAEHVIEHVDLREGLRFLGECFRVLRPHGVIRLAFPDPARIASLPTDDLLTYAQILGLPKPTPIRAELLRFTLTAVLAGWGHRSAWTEELAFSVLTACSFEQVYFCQYGDSAFEDMRGIEGHHLAPGVGAAAKLETSIVEAVRP